MEDSGQHGTVKGAMESHESNLRKHLGREGCVQVGISRGEPGIWGSWLPKGPLEGYPAWAGGSGNGLSEASWAVRTLTTEGALGYP